jgi:hypothetical protein
MEKLPRHKALLDFNNVGDALPIRYAYPTLIAATCGFNSPLSRSSASNIDHELETLGRVSIGAQQRLEHAYAIFAHDPPLLKFFVSNARIDRCCVELHQISGFIFGLVFVTDEYCRLPGCNKVSGYCLKGARPFVWTRLE